jgi:biopolymer transport protein ExbB
MGFTHDQTTESASTPASHSPCRPTTKNLLVTLTALGLLAGLLLAAAPSLAWAQAEDTKKEEKKEEKKDEKKSQSLFMHIFVSAGPFFGPLLFIVSVALITLIVLLAMDLRMSLAVPGYFVDQFTELVNKRQFKGAFELCRNDTSYIARVLTAGMGRLQYGIEDAREACFNMVDSVRAGKDNLITYLGTIGTLGPMLGLVGTVYGMIMSFMELSANVAPNPQRLADGISHALVVTLLGIGISVPAIFCYSFFKNRLVRISMDTSNLADDLLTQMYHNSKKVAAEAEPAPARTTAPAAKSSPGSSSITPARPKRDE